MTDILIPEKQVTVPAVGYKISLRCYDELSKTAKATLVNSDGSGATVEVAIPYANLSLKSAKEALAVDLEAEVVEDEKEPVEPVVEPIAEPV